MPHCHFLRYSSQAFLKGIQKCITQHKKEGCSKVLTMSVRKKKVLNRSIPKATPFVIILKCKKSSQCTSKTFWTEVRTKKAICYCLRLQDCRAFCCFKGDSHLLLKSFFLIFLKCNEMFCMVAYIFKMMHIKKEVPCIIIHAFMTHTHI